MTAAADAVADAPCFKLTAQPFGVIATIGQKSRATAGTQPTSPGDLFHQADDKPAFVQVPARHLNRQRHPTRITDQMDFAGGFTAVDRARARLGAPFFAGTVVASTISRRVSKPPALSSSSTTA